MRDWEKEREQRNKRARGNFARSLELMYSRDNQFAEDGFHQLQSIAADHVEELIAEFRRQPGLGERCWLLELISEAGSPAAFGLLVEQLTNEEYDSLRFWAQRGLQKLGTKEARRVLHEHGLPTR